MKKLLAIIVSLLFSTSAMADLVVIGNIAGPNSLKQSQVKRLFLGKSKKLPNGEYVKLIELQNGNASRIAFHKKNTERTEAQLQSSWSRLIFTGKADAPTQVDDFKSVIGEVEAATNAIGYIEESMVTANIKVLFKP